MTLLHVCCAPCSIRCVASLREEGIEPTLFWYNPNIHPFTEYRSRRDALVDYAGRVGAALVQRDEYGLRAFLAAVGPEGAGRCAHCYRVRLEETARRAAACGCDSFSTTLLISPYQDHEALRAAAGEAAARHGVNFLYRDFRPLFRAGQREAGELNLYRQKYCGCIFSEEERYRPAAKTV
ncbi:MAG: epoxyqueuosine reductase QueH [Oscillospiraceae bacterium]|nr:epoxyqueuosine reductase QueH [Oscillospiraceae bacterium]